MATAPDSASRAPAKPKFDATALITTALWGIGAAAALFLAVMAGLSDHGARRIMAAVSTPPKQAEKSATLQFLAPKPVAVTHIQAPPKPQIQAQVQLPPKPSPETRRLQEQVRALVADQDRLLQRISALEHNLEEVTGSVRRQEAAAKQEAAARAAAPAPTPVASGPVSTVSWPAIITAISTSGPWPDPPSADAEPEVTASIPQETPLPLRRPEPPLDPERTTAAGATPA